MVLSYFIIFCVMCVQYTVCAMIITTLQLDERTLFTCAFLNLNVTHYSTYWTQTKKNGHNNAIPFYSIFCALILCFFSVILLTTAFIPCEINIYFTPVKIYLSRIPNVYIYTNQYKCYNICTATRSKKK